MRTHVRLGLSQWIGLGAVVAASVALSGCNANQGVRTGVSLADAGHYEAQVGDYSPDFAFVSDDESLTRFSDVRGRVTVLAFPDDPAWPNCKNCQKIAQIASEASEARIDVVAVAVAGPNKPCHEALPNVQSCDLDAAHLVAICDRRGEIRHIYGSQVDGKYFVVDNHGKIAASGNVGDWEQLRADVAATVQRVADEEFGPEAEI